LFTRILGILGFSKTSPRPSTVAKAVEKAAQRSHLTDAVADNTVVSDRSKRGRRRRKPKSSIASQALPPWDSSVLDIPRLEGKTRFYDLPLPDVLLRGIHDLGFQYCSPIQAQILPETLQGKDAIGKAQTGTGKTAAFLITVMVDLLKHPHAADRGKGKPRALIIAPTRELVAQITEDARALG
jgi:ATP-dependent RNA helicase RhlB